MSIRLTHMISILFYLDMFLLPVLLKYIANFFYNGINKLRTLQQEVYSELEKTVYKILALT